MPDELPAEVAVMQMQLAPGDGVVYLNADSFGAMGYHLAAAEALHQAADRV